MVRAEFEKEDTGRRQQEATSSQDDVYVFPVSFAQQRLWFLHQLEPDSPFYNIPIGLRLVGPLDTGALEATLGEIIRRHESLRTTFQMVGSEPAQIVHDHVRVRLPVEDLSGLPPDERDEEALRLATEEVWQPFDLAEGPLLRARLLRLGEEEHVALLTMHHIISDGWSRGVLVGEVAALYEAFRHGRPSPLPELPIQYADFAEWQRAWLRGAELERQLSYWREQLGGAAPLLELPTDRPRPTVQSYRGAMQTFNIAPDLTAELKRLGQRERATLFMTLLAGFKVLLHHYTSQDDIVIGTPVAGRNRAETENLIGFFVNTLVLRTRLDGGLSFRRVLERVRETALGAYAHQDLPFEKLVEELQPERSLSHTPLFQIVFALQNAPSEALELSGLHWRSVEVEGGTSKFDLTMIVTEIDDGLTGSLEYNTDLFDNETVARMLRRFEILLRGVVAAPDRAIAELPLLTDDEARLLDEWNDTSTDYPRLRCIQELFEEQVALRPDARALVFGDTALTYRELNERANRVAHRLRRLGVGPETLVGICLERSAELITGLLGILKAGGAYVPLDVSYPPERLAFMMEDTGMRVLLTEERLRGALPSDGIAVLSLDGDAESLALESDADPEHDADAPDNLAYVIYTSGSTGRPKGVSVTHRSVIRLVRDTNFADFNREEVFLQFAPVSFDASTFEIWGALLNGARLVVMSPGNVSLEELASTLERNGVTTLWLTAGLFHLMVDERLEGLRPVRQLLAGGDVLSVRHVKKLLSELPGCRLINGYGPTENTTFTCCHTMTDASRIGATVPIGTPISNTRVYIVNSHMQRTPVGVPGELLAGGDGLARDYLNRPELTAERFIPDPFGTEPGARLYRIGDLARYLPDGTIEFLGRIDHQVKIRGFRIELEEIEVVLSEHPDVRQCVVTVSDDVPGEKQLAAYVAAEPGRPLKTEDLREYLAGRLPHYMVPSYFVLLDELPLTPNGKVDRRALPTALATTGREESYLAPRTPTEELLCAVFSQVLGLSRIGVHDNFFHAGGHSLSATQVVSRARSLLRTDITLRDLFEAPTAEALASRLTARGVGAQSAAAVEAPLALSREGEPLLTSYAQRRLWFIEQLEPGTAAYNVPAAVRLRGRLDSSALEESLREVVRRHGSLRTTFTAEDGEPRQIVHPDDGWQWTMRRVSLTGVDEEERKEEARRVAAVESERPFDLGGGESLLRATLIEMSEEEHVLVLVMHHIISDGWSLGVLVGEVTALYGARVEGRESGLEELGIQYADYARWQREWLSGGALEEQMKYWRERLRDAAPALELPTDRSRAAVQQHRAGMETKTLPTDLAEELRLLSWREGATLFMTLLAAFDVLLWRYTGQDDIVVGTPIAGRNRAEIENLIGFFINNLVLRTDLSGDPTFLELLGRVRETALGAYAHQDLPFEKLVEELQPERSLSHHPLFQVMFVLQNTPPIELKLPGLTLDLLPGGNSLTQFEWVLNIVEEKKGLSFSLEYSADVFDRETIKRLLDNMEVLLRAVVADPGRKVSRLPLLGEDERRRLLVEWDGTKVEREEKTIHQMFAAQVAQRPDAVAVSFKGDELTYGALDERSSRIADGLRGLGAEPGRPVAVMLASGTVQVASLLGVLKAGCPFVALDPNYPTARLRRILDETEPSCLLTDDEYLRAQRELLGEFQLKTGCRYVTLEAHDGPPDGLEVIEGADWFHVAPVAIAAAAALDVGPRELAYIVYTSGSTGRPKGIMQTHDSFCQYIEWQAREFAIGPGSRVAQWASITYDASYAEIFGALCCGATLCMTDALTRGNPLTVYRWLKSEQVSLLITVPSFAAQILDLIESEASEAEDARGAQSHPLPDLDVLFLAGEVMPLDFARAWLRRFPERPRLYNLYGPTESILATFQRVEAIGEAQRSVPVGRAIDGRHVLLLDEQQQLSPLGGKGEIYIRSPYLTEGYFKRPDETARVFLQSPLGDDAPGRVYRTGDLGRWHNDGTLELFGRLDHQVKVRGMRVELDEIEAVLRRHEAVEECAVAVHSYGAGDQRLIGYAVMSGGDAATAIELRAFVKEQLPEYMVPSAIIFLDEMPRTRSGKVDRPRLLRPDAGEVAQAVEYVAPRTPMEEMVAEVWRELLHVERVGANDNFFDLGGHSLLATQVVNKLRNVCGVELPLRELFEAPTVSALASRIEAAQIAQHTDQGEVAELIERVEGLSDEEVLALLEDA